MRDRDRRLAAHYDALARERGASPLAGQNGSLEKAELRAEMALGLLDDWRGKTVLEIGCGVGWLAPRLIEAGVERYLGVDVSPEAIALAKKHYAKPDVTFICGSVKHDLGQERGFDAVVGIVFFTDIGRWKRDMSGIVNHVCDLAREGVYLGVKPGAGRGWAAETAELWHKFETVRAIKVASLDEVHIYGNGKR